LCRKLGYFHAGKKELTRMAWERGGNASKGNARRLWGTIDAFSNESSKRAKGEDRGVPTVAVQEERKRGEAKPKINTVLKGNTQQTTKKTTRPVKKRAKPETKRKWSKRNKIQAIQKFQSLRGACWGTIREKMFIRKGNRDRADNPREKKKQRHGSQGKTPEDYTQVQI